MDTSTREALERDLRRLLEAEDEETQDRIHQEIDRLSPDPEWSDHVFHSDVFYRPDGTLDAAAVVERIATHRPMLP